MKTKEIWEKILLKKVYGYELTNTVTIEKNEQNNKRKYQVFEVLVAETLALLDTKTKWETTCGNNDQGVDIVGSRKAECTTPFLSNVPEQLYLGQIKRRNKGYRYDDFRNDINKLFEFYSSKVLYKDATLMQLIFVISSDNENNIKNLQKNLLKDIEIKEHLIFIAGIKSPISIINALDIIKYWKINFDFVKNITNGIFSYEELVQFKEFLENIEFSGISFSVKQNTNAYLGKMHEFKIQLTTEIKDIPIEAYIKWSPATESLKHIQLVSPWTLCEERGMHVYIENLYELPILFRGVSVGTFSLGDLEIVIPDSTYSQKIELGNITIQKNPFPLYMEAPNSNIKTDLEKHILEGNIHLYACAVLGCGGIGKSSLINEILIKSVNAGFYCINIEHSHSLVSGNKFFIQLIICILSQSFHRIIFINEIADYVCLFLGGLYKKEWEEALENLVSDKTYDPDYICDCIVSLLIKITWQTNCILYFSDMHWLNNKNADLLRRIYFSIEHNLDYIGKKIIILLEGRYQETLFYNNRHYLPYVWENFLSVTGIEKKELQNWKHAECEKFLESLFYRHKKENNKELTNLAKNEILNAANGIPMHILEQVKFLIEQGKILAKDNGELYIFESNWNNLLSKNITELVSYRIQYYYQQYPEIMDYLVIYTKLNLNLTPACAKYIYKILHKNYSSEISILESISFIEIKNEIIYFQHEYYSEGLKNLAIKKEKSIDDIFKWFHHKEKLTDYESLCRLQLLEMYEFVDYENLCKELLLFLQIVTDEYIKQQAYHILLGIPEDILKKYEMVPCEIKYNLCESILLTGDWRLAKKYFLELVKTNNSEQLYEIYYVALSYQDLSNISSGELLLDESLMFADKGLEMIENATLMFGEENIPDFLMQARDMLIERKAICYEFSGNLDKALELQKKAFENATLRKDNYVMLRVRYEREGTNLHINLDKAVEQLNVCYNEACSMSMLFHEEEVLIKTMELLGRTKQLYSATSDISIDAIYREAILLAENQQKKYHNYSASIHLITIAAILLLKDNNPFEALKYLFQSLERALNTHLNELLWKSYINIAQLNEYLGNHEEAIYYAQKTLNILSMMIEKNPENQDNIISLLYEPLKHLENILDVEIGWVKNRTFNSGRLKIHSFIWKNIELFVMN